MQETSFIVIRGNSMRLDGGTMFGNAPKALWQKWIQADERGMIDIASNCLLVKTGNYNLLFDTGCGAYLSPDMKARFAVKEEKHMLLQALTQQGVITSYSIHYTKLYETPDTRRTVCEQDINVACQYPFSGLFPDQGHQPP